MGEREGEKKSTALGKIRNEVVKSMNRSKVSTGGNSPSVDFPAGNLFNYTLFNWTVAMRRYDNE